MTGLSQYLEAPNQTDLTVSDSEHGEYGEALPDPTGFWREFRHLERPIPYVNTLPGILLLNDLYLSVQFVSGISLALFR